MDWVDTPPCGPACDRYDAQILVCLPPFDLARRRWQRVRCVVIERGFAGEADRDMHELVARVSIRLFLEGADMHQRGMMARLRTQRLR